LNPIVMLIWTLPVVIVCIRHGMRAGAATIAVAGFIILGLGTPLNALDMLLTSASPALIIGCGFYYKWPTEKTLLFTAIAAILGLGAVILISIFIMGIGLRQIFGIDPETIEQVIAMFSDNPLLSGAYDSPEALAAAIYSMIEMFEYFIPLTISIYGLFSALSNYIIAHLVLRRLKEPVPPMTKLATFSLPRPLAFGAVLGFGLLILGTMYMPDAPIVALAGQNMQTITLLIYMFQGFGVISHFMNKMQPQSRRMAKIAIVLGVLVTGFNLLGIIGVIGLFDAFADIRGLGLWKARARRENT